MLFLFNQHPKDQSGTLFVVAILDVSAAACPWSKTRVWFGCRLFSCTSLQLGVLLLCILCDLVAMQGSTR